MVQIFKRLLKSMKKPVRAHLRGSFIDSLRITVHGGHGGNGVPKYGGIGGQGGCVYFVAKDGITLRNIAQQYRDKRVAASNGEDGSKVRILGRRGIDERVEVPTGVQVLLDNGKIIGDLNEENASCIAAGGGAGGCSGTNFLGKPGEHRTVSLDLKLIADVGLVGFPNAGKSTLLKALSNANPRIASYPFTTIRPQIGSIEYPDFRTITIADLPGLIEGAHANFGMGHKFLKHIERTRLLLMMVDIDGFRLSPKHEQRNCLQTIYALNRELELYDPTLLDKPCVLLVNKMDKQGAHDHLSSIEKMINCLEDGLDLCPESFRPTRVLQFESIIPISAKNSARVNEVKNSLREVMDVIAERSMDVNKEQLQERLQQSIEERGPKIT